MNQTGTLLCVAQNAKRCLTVPFILAAAIAWAAASPSKNAALSPSKNTALSPSKNKDLQPALRWAEGRQGCTFVRGDDGKYRYGLWMEDLGITLVVDSQELQRTRHRLDPFIGLVLTFRYRGAGEQEIAGRQISLEFVTHSHVVHSALDPDAFATEYQNNVDAFAEENAREIEKHPEKKEAKEAMVRAYEKELVEVQEFLTTRGLRDVKLDAANPQASGWIFFRAKDKWIGAWKKKEEFVLRVSLPNRVVEFPFSLPPSVGDVILRRRTN